MLANDYYEDFAYGDYANNSVETRDDGVYANAYVESMTGYPSHKHAGIIPEDMGW